MDFLPVPRSRLKEEMHAIARRHPEAYEKVVKMEGSLMDMLARLPGATKFAGPVNMEVGLLDGLRRIQVESWSDAEGRHVLLVVQSIHSATAEILTRTGGSDGWTFGSTRVRPCTSHHDRHAIARGIKRRPASKDDMVRTGLFGPSSTLERKVFERMHGIEPDLRGMMHSQSRLYRPRQEMDDARPPAETYYPTPDIAFAQHRLAAITECRLNHREPMPANGHGTPPPGIIVFNGNWNGATHVLSDLFDPAYATLLEPGDMEVALLIGDAAWSSQAHAFYGADGTLGERRRQAARLYPILAPLMATTESVSRLIDAARPYEAALCKALDRMLPVGDGPGLTQAALRRLRLLRPGWPGHNVAAAVHLAWTLPLDWVPATETAWQVALGAVGPEYARMATLGIHARQAVSHVAGDWERIFECIPGTESQLSLGLGDAPVQSQGDGRKARAWLHSTLQGIQDMGTRLDDTLLSQVMASADFPAMPRGASRSLACKLLTEERSLPSLHRLQDRWHKGLSRMEANLPAFGVDNRWPALFASYVAPNGLEFRCLVNEVELKEEGGEGPDADGVAGLDHCVGGYGRACFTGASHIISIRRRVGDGFERVSTAEFAVLADDDEDSPRELRGDLWSAPRLDLEQHLSHGNDEPPEEAVEAVTAFMAAVASQELNLNPEAMSRRDGGGYVETYDWRVPGTLDQAFLAWAPYLPRQVARGGLKALIDRLREIVPTLPRGDAHSLAKAGSNEVLGLPPANPMGW